MDIFEVIPTQGRIEKLPTNHPVGGNPRFASASVCSATTLDCLADADAGADGNFSRDPTQKTLKA